MDDAEIQHLLELREGYQARIRILQQRRARRGELSSGDALELQQAERDLELVSAQLQSTPPSPHLAELIPEARFAVMEVQMKAMNDRLNDGLTFINMRFEEFIELQAERWRSTDEAREKGQAQRTKELRELWTVIGILIAAVVVLAIAHYSRL